MNIGFKATQGQGKTASMVYSLVELCNWYGYDAKEACGNVTVNLPGYKRLSNEELRDYIKWVLKRGERHRIILCDEIDQVFPSRFFADKEQTLGLLGLWQDEKLFNYFLYTCHLGTSVDKIIRDATQILLFPTFNKEEDSIELEIANGLDMENLGDVIYPASYIWTPGKIWYKGNLIEKKLYDRWELAR